MATSEVSDSPMEGQIRADKLNRRAARKRKQAGRKEKRAKRAEAKGKTGRAAILRGKAKKKTGKAEVKEARADRAANRGKKLKAGAKKAGGKIKAGVKKKVDKKVSKIKGKVEKVKKTVGKVKAKAKEVKGKVKEKVAKTKRKVAAASTAFKGTEMNGPAVYGEGKHQYKRKDEDGVETKAGDIGGHYKDYEGTSMGVHDDDTEYRTRPMDAMKGGNWDGSSMYGPSKYDNSHMLKNPGHHQAPSMTGKEYDQKKMFSTKGKERLHYLENFLHDKKKGSSLSKHFGRNSSKKR